jgi:hypothetical protein
MLRLFSIARRRGEMSRWLARSLSHQCALTAFASCLSIASASVKAIGPAIIGEPCRLIAFRLMKFCKTSSAAAAALSADGGELIGGAAADPPKEAFQMLPPMSWACRRPALAG